MDDHDFPNIGSYCIWSILILHHHFVVDIVHGRVEMIASHRPRSHDTFQGHDPIHVLMTNETNSQKILVFNQKNVIDMYLAAKKYRHHKFHSIPLPPPFRLRLA